MAASIENLPVEVLVLIFEYLSFSDVVENCSNTCFKWRYITAQFFIGSYLHTYAIMDEDIKDILYDNGWTEKSNDNNFIIYMYEYITSYKGTHSDTLNLFKQILVNKKDILLHIYYI